MGRFERVALTVLVLFLAYGLLVAFRLGRAVGRDGEREQAVQAGVGRWACDPKTGEKRFEYGP